MANQEPSADFVALLQANQALAWREAFSVLYPIAWRGTGHARWRLAETVADLLQDLGEPGATMVRAYLQESKSYQEIAEQHGKPIGTVGTLIYRAIQQLRRDVSRSPKLMKELQLYLRLLVLA